MYQGGLALHCQHLALLLVPAHVGVQAHAQQGQRLYTHNETLTLTHFGVKAHVQNQALHTHTDTR